LAAPSSGIDRETKYANAAERRIAGVQFVPSPSIAPFVTAREAAARRRFRV